MDGIRTVVRVNEENPNHHIYSNNGVFWVHYTQHLPDFTKRRVRQSLRTHCLNTARIERDRLFRRFQPARSTGRTADVLPLAA